MVQPEEPRAKYLSNKKVKPSEENLYGPQGDINYRLDTVEHRLNNIDVEPVEAISQRRNSILDAGDSGLRKPVNKPADYSANPAPDGLHIINPQTGEESTDRSKRGSQGRHSGVDEPGHDI